MTNGNFVCTQCGSIDSIFISPPAPGAPFLCAKCLTGEWHGQFPQEKATGEFEHDGPLINDVTAGDKPSFS